MNISYIICVNWTRTGNEEKIEQEQGMKKGMGERRVDGGGGGVCDCSFGELLDKKHSRPLYILKHVTCLKIISFCSFESVWLPLVKSLRSKTQ
jgi:hypothetical protein